ncbi:MAG: TIGR04282 family arsenosugar biosynthesis glycosyltransferase [Myxococcales bacterium]|nr:TIGR04282 family arsenosugar biosynthesis glycosyltransferase [Myxococcales bacterium]MCB9577402.1 TIGR04282 family arsenosugar biosynthesis glycosyltransferase [Polyangiaceae bacterium]
MILVFAKEPAPGTVKTRLAQRIGPERAAELAVAFLRDTWELVASMPGLSPVLVLDGATPFPAEVWPQGDGDLGARMERALRRGIEAAGFAIAIGTDLPGLPAARLRQAADALQSGRAASVLGPAEDGGFYLIGLSRCPPGALSGLPWSTPSTCEATEARLTELGMPPLRLEQWFDVDEAKDLERVRQHGGAHARAVLAGWERR